MEFKDLCRTFKNRDSFIKESGGVSTGSILSIKGPSGAGKSTLLRMLARLIKPENGDIYLRGQHWLSIPPGTWRRRIHYLSQKPIMFAGTVEDNFRLPFAVKSAKEQGPYTRDNVESYMKALDLPMNYITQEAQTLSGGEASRVALIRALLVEPEVLLLDEPTAYLDGDSRSRVIQMISGWIKAQPGRAVIIVSHNEDEIKNLDNLSVLEISDDKGALQHG